MTFKVGDRIIGVGQHSGQDVTDLTGTIVTISAPSWAQDGYHRQEGYDVINDRVTLYGVLFDEKYDDYDFHDLWSNDTPIVFDNEYIERHESHFGLKREYSCRGYWMPSCKMRLVYQELQYDPNQQADTSEDI